MEKRKRDQRTLAEAFPTWSEYIARFWAWSDRQKWIDSIVDFIGKWRRAFIGLFLIIAIVDVIGMYIITAFVGTIALRPTAEVTVENGQIVRMWFPPNKTAIWPCPKDEGYLIERDRESHEYWESWVRDILQDQANPDSWLPREVTVLEKKGDGTYRMTWEQFLEQNPGFVIQ